MTPYLWQSLKENLSFSLAIFVRCSGLMLCDRSESFRYFMKSITFVESSGSGIFMKFVILLRNARSSCAGKLVAAITVTCPWILHILERIRFRTRLPVPASSESCLKITLNILFILFNVLHYLLRQILSTSSIKRAHGWEFLAIWKYLSTFFSLSPTYLRKIMFKYLLAIIFFLNIPWKKLWSFHMD